MGSLRLFTANTRAVRTFIFSRPFYSIFQHRRLNNLFGNRPKHLAEIGTIDQKIWEKYQTYLKRLESHPLKKAEYYYPKTFKRCEHGKGTVRNDRGRLVLYSQDPADIGASPRDPEFSRGEFLPRLLKNFHLRRLLEITRMGDERDQLAKFREILFRPGKKVIRF